MVVGLDHAEVDVAPGTHVVEDAGGDGVADELLGLFLLKWSSRVIVLVSSRKLYNLGFSKVETLGQDHSFIRFWCFFSLEVPRDCCILQVATSIQQ